MIFFYDVVDYHENENFIIHINYLVLLDTNLFYSLIYYKLYYHYIIHDTDRGPIERIAPGNHKINLNSALFEINRINIITFSSKA